MPLASLLLFLILNATAVQLPAQQSQIHLIIDQLEPAQGDLHLAIYSQKDFLEEAGILKGLILPIRQSTITCTLPPLPYGTYAIAVFHDLNGNGQLDKNSLGVPTEPYGFSNDVRSKWRAPSFSEAAIRVELPALRLRLRVRHWKQQ